MTDDYFYCIKCYAQMIITPDEILALGPPPLPLPLCKKCEYQRDEVDENELWKADLHAFFQKAIKERKTM